MNRSEPPGLRIFVYYKSLQVYWFKCEMRLFGLRDVTPASVRQAGPETGILRPFKPSSLPLYAIDLATFDNLNIRSYNYNLSYLRITVHLLLLLQHFVVPVCTPAHGQRLYPHCKRLLSEECKLHRRTRS